MLDSSFDLALRMRAIYADLNSLRAGLALVKVPCCETRYSPCARRNTTRFDGNGRWTSNNEETTGISILEESSSTFYLSCGELSFYSPNQRVTGEPSV